MSRRAGADTDGDGLASATCDRLVTPSNLELVRNKFPGHCRYHILHNLLGGHEGGHKACSSAPFQDGVCEHGSHSRPAISDHSQVAEGTPLHLPLGLSRRAGSARLYDGCPCRGCNTDEDEGVACMLGCRRAWLYSRRRGWHLVAADDDAMAALGRSLLEEEGGESWYHEEDEESGHHDEEWDDEQYQDEWYNDEQGDDEDEWDDEEEGEDPSTSKSAVIMCLG